MSIYDALTDSAVLRTLGQRIEHHRLEANLTQAELAEQAGIGKRTLERIETGHGSELVTVIRILRVLRLIEGLDLLIPEVPPSPIAQLKGRSQQRQRVTHARGSRPEGAQGRSSGRAPPVKPWTWSAPGAPPPAPAKRKR